MTDNRLATRLQQQGYPPTGNCFSIALALKQVLGGELCGVYERSDEGELIGPYHVLIVKDGHYIDGYGQRDRSSICAGYKKYATEGEVVIESADQSTVRGRAERGSDRSLDRVLSTVRQCIRTVQRNSEMTIVEP